MRRINLSVKRALVQLITTLVINGNFTGFASGTVYSGKLKQACVPGLNCYSCPGALGSCPLGALQAMLADPEYKMSFYIIGLLTVFGIAAGRRICGWLCPFGFLQELLHLPVKLAAKRRGSVSISRKRGAPFVFRYVKYIILISFVLLAPLFFTDEYGYGAPYFCGLICPSGTIMGALPLFVANPALLGNTGAVFYLKLTVAAIVITGSLASNRFFCKYLCPLGAIYGLFNRVALTRLAFYAGECTGCGKCASVCGMDIDPRNPDHSAECIQCGKCAEQCQWNALRMETPEFFRRRRKAGEKAGE